MILVFIVDSNTILQKIKDVIYIIFIKELGVLKIMKNDITDRMKGQNQPKIVIKQEKDHYIAELAQGEIELLEIPSGLGKKISWDELDSTVLGFMKKGYRIQGYTPSISGVLGEFNQTRIEVPKTYSPVVQERTLMNLADAAQLWYSKKNNR